MKVFWFCVALILTGTVIVWVTVLGLDLGQELEIRVAFGEGLILFGTLTIVAFYLSGRKQAESLMKDLEEIGDLLVEENATE